MSNVSPYLRLVPRSEIEVRNAILSRHARPAFIAPRTFQPDPTIDFKIGDTSMNNDFWSTYSLIPEPASLRRARVWPLYIGWAVIAVGLALLFVLGAA